MINAKIQDKKEDNTKALNMIDDGGKEESTLLMAVFYEGCEVLFQESGENLSGDDLWYLDISASSHMTNQRSLFYIIDEGQSGIV